MIEKSSTNEFLVTCPICGDSYTHQHDVESFERLGGEDGKTIRMTPGSNESEVSNYNPSKRRNAVSIQMEGECGHFWSLNISQHKGQTFIDHC